MSAPERKAAPVAEAERAPRRAWLVAGAAWLVPGLGHLLLGRRARALLFAVLVFGALAIGVALRGPLMFFEGGVIGKLVTLASMGVGLPYFVLRLGDYQGEAIGQSIGYELRLAYFEKLQRMSFAYHDRVHSGDLMTRGMLDIEGIRRFVDGAMLRTIVLAVLLLYGGYRMISTDAALGLLALAFVPVVVWRGSM